LSGINTIGISMFKFIKNYLIRKLEIELTGLEAKYNHDQKAGWGSQNGDIAKGIAILEKKLEWLNKK
jgi:hypothetical protein